jgi:hypothetical protein
LGVCQAIYFWWVIHNFILFYKFCSRRRRISKRKEDEEERRRRRSRSGFKSAVIFAGIWEFFFGVWSFDGGKQSGFGFWVSLVFGCGVLMEQNRWFLGFWVSFPICSFAK